MVPGIYLTKSKMLPEETMALSHKASTKEQIRNQFTSAVAHDAPVG